VSHTHYPADYWTRPHPEPVVLDIGGDVGALLLYTPPALHGREIEVSPLGQDTQRVHTAVLERVIGGRTRYVAVYPELRAGDYRIWGDDPSLESQVTIVGGAVAEVDWTNRG
jgi:hypothetical protein